MSERKNNRENEEEKGVQGYNFCSIRLMNDDFWLIMCSNEMILYFEIEEKKATKITFYSFITLWKQRKLVYDEE